MHFIYSNYHSSFSGLTLILVAGEATFVQMAEETCIFNVGGCLYSIPLNRLACFQESLLMKGCVSSDRARLFLDRDGFTFRHLHYYIHTGKLASSCISEVNILYELASSLRLTSLQQVSDCLTIANG